MSINKKKNSTYTQTDESTNLWAINSGSDDPCVPVHEAVRFVLKSAWYNANHFTNRARRAVTSRKNYRWRSIVAHLPAGEK
jgi:hypothetical protein